MPVSAIVPAVPKYYLAARQPRKPPPNCQKTEKVIVIPTEVEGSAVVLALA
jgi:hypothetical protein